MKRPFFRITETGPIDIDGGCLIDGFPSVGFTSAIAVESLIHTTKFELAGILDSDAFPAISLVRDGVPNFPTTIHVNNDLKVGVFSSYLTLNESLHKMMARTMLEWAKKHHVSYVISSVATKSGSEKVTAAGSTDAAKAMLREKDIRILERGAIPGIPGALLNQGRLNKQNVIVILFNPGREAPDFKSSADLCGAISKLIPGASCNIPALQKEAEKVEKSMNEAKAEAKNLHDGMYR